MPTFVIGGLLALMVFLSAFGVWAKQTCTCGCFLGLSSCLSVLTMLLELTFAILTLTARDQVLQAACKKVKDSHWDSAKKQCISASPSAALGFEDGSGSGGGDNHSPAHLTENILEDYKKWSDIIAYVLFGLSFLHLCRFIMGRYVQPEMSELGDPLNASFKSSRDDVENMRARNRFMRSQEAAMRDGTQMSGVDESGEVFIKEESSCVIS